MIGTDEAFLSAIGRLYGHGLCTLAHVLHCTLSRVDCFIADPFDRVGRLVGTFSDSMDNDMAAFFASQVTSLCGIFEAVDRGLFRELYRFDRAVGSFYG